MDPFSPPFWETLDPPKFSLKFTILQSIDLLRSTLLEVNVINKIQEKLSYFSTTIRDRTDLINSTEKTFAQRKHCSVDDDKAVRRRGLWWRTDHPHRARRGGGGAHSQGGVSEPKHCDHRRSLGVTAAHSPGIKTTTKGKAIYSFYIMKVVVQW